MPITFDYDPKQNILFSRATGTVTLADVEEHLKDESAANLLGCPELFDARGGSTTLTPDEVKLLVARLRDIANRQPFGPTGVVTDNDVFFGMARMVAIISELRGGPPVAVFRNTEDGFEWLHSYAPDRKD